MRLPPGCTEALKQRKTVVTSASLRSLSKQRWSSLDWKPVEKPVPGERPHISGSSAQTLIPGEVGIFWLVGLTSPFKRYASGSAEEKEKKQRGGEREVKYV